MCPSTNAQEHLHVVYLHCGWKRFQESSIGEHSESVENEYEDDIITERWGAPLKSGFPEQLYSASPMAFSLEGMFDVLFFDGRKQARERVSTAPE